MHVPKVQSSEQNTFCTVPFSSISHNSFPPSLHEVPDMDDGAKTIDVPCLLPHEIFDAVWRAGSQQDWVCPKICPNLLDVLWPCSFNDR